MGFRALSNQPKSRYILCNHLNALFMDLTILKETAQAMVAPGKGVLAIDESTGTCTKRFEALGVECNEESRRHYRGLLVSAPVSENISGMILFEETLRQANDEGVSFPEVLSSAGIIPGIKVDQKAHDLALHPGEKVTEGLDGLRERLQEFKSLGARFAKWRAVIAIGENLPSQACITANAHALARYASLCQEADVVPMVEPEILLDGDHSIERCYEVTAEVLQALFSHMKEQGVAMEGAILKVSMVLSGKNHPEQADAETVARETVRCLKENVPHDLAGVVFLSGGQSPADSTIHLHLMNSLHDDLPWPLSFSYGRGIQQPALELWAQDNDGNYEAAQNALAHRAKMNGLAAEGKYSEEAEQAA